MDLEAEVGHTQGNSEHPRTSAVPWPLSCLTRLRIYPEGTCWSTAGYSSTCSNC